MQKTWSPQDEVFWYRDRPAELPCKENQSVEIAIIGGGMAGLSAAQAFTKRGKKVALLEQYYCGAGASGKSSGFITPNAELSLHDFVRLYDENAAHGIWDLILQGASTIRNTILLRNMDCDYVTQNTLVVANNETDFKELIAEHNYLKKFSYPTHLFSKEEVPQKIRSENFFGGMTYEDTFGINGYHYCHSLKHHLKNEGVLIFEETPVIKIDGQKLTTPHAEIAADYIVICADRFLPNLNLLQKPVYHAQTFLMMSESLTDRQIHAIFPEDPLMVWDSDLFYKYFRLTGDNRLLLGGSSWWSIYSSNADHECAAMVHNLTQYFNSIFPESKVKFEYMWPGLVGVSKDIAPLAGRDKHNKHIYYISAAAGLPVAAGLGEYCAQNILENRTDLDDYFSPYRQFPVSNVIQSLIGKKLSFALSNYLTKRHYTNIHS